MPRNMLRNPRVYFRIPGLGFPIGFSTGVSPGLWLLIILVGLLFKFVMMG